MCLPRVSGQYLGSETSQQTSAPAGWPSSLNGWFEIGETEEGGADTGTCSLIVLEHNQMNFGPLLTCYVFVVSIISTCLSAWTDAHL